MSTYAATKTLIPASLSRVFMSTFAALLILKFSEKKIPQLMTSSFKLLKNEMAQLKGRLYYSNGYQELEQLIEASFWSN